MCAHTATISTPPLSQRHHPTPHDRGDNIVTCLEPPPNATPPSPRLNHEGRDPRSRARQGWRTQEHPDPDNKTLEAVVRALRAPLGEHIDGLFWDYACLWQKPRSSEQDEQFHDALNVMADGYASPLGVAVLRRRVMPPCPEELQGEVIVEGVAAAGTEAVIRQALTAHGQHTLTSLQHNAERECWAAHFASHADAIETVQQLTAATSAAPPAPSLVGATWRLAYHDKAYDSRGWPVFESSVSTEALAALQHHERLRQKLDRLRLPPKVIEIDEEVPAPIPAVPEWSSTDERIAAISAKLRRVDFTSASDKEVVVKLFENYASKIGAAIGGSGEGMAVQYVGERNAKGEREGRGRLREGDGDVYEGNWKAGKRHGPGVATSPPRGSILGVASHGNWEQDRWCGPFSMRFSDGRVRLRTYWKGYLVGEEVEWSADRQTAHHIRHMPRWMLRLNPVAWMPPDDIAFTSFTCDGGCLAFMTTFVHVFYVLTIIPICALLASEKYYAQLKPTPIAPAKARALAARIGLPAMPPEDATYEGETNAAGEPHGMGKKKWAEGAVVYKGFFDSNRRDGVGVLHYANGTTFKGSWKANEMHGPFVVLWPDGRVRLTSYGRPTHRLLAGIQQVGEGVEYSADRQTARRIKDGVVQRVCSLAQARDIAERLELAVPSAGSMQQSAQYV